jgi:hypothetical protein
MPKLMVADPFFCLKIGRLKATVCRVTHPSDLENQFFNRWMLYCTDRIALRWAIFKRKKGFVTISLGLIYHSMVLSQSPSRDTAPLNCVN